MLGFPIRCAPDHLDNRIRWKSASITQETMQSFGKRNARACAATRLAVDTDMDISMCGYET